MKQPEPDALAFENQTLQVQNADLQANLILSETKLASQQQNQNVDHVRQQLLRVESEMQKLNLRYQNRPVPYHMIIREHFDENQLQKFVDPAHECHCNLCGKDLDQLVKEALQAKQAQEQLANPSSEQQLQLPQLQLS